MSVKTKLALSILTLLVFFAVVESAVRVFNINTYFQSRFFLMNRTLDYPDVFERDRRLFWKPRPNQTVTSQFFEGRTYRLNFMGLRGSDFEIKKNRPRIIALGNSCTFGWGVEESEIFTALMQNQLDKYEVINAGVPGYSSFQGKIFYESKITGLKPDILLILFAWNDQWLAANDIPDKNQKFPPELVIKTQNLLNHFHSYRLLKRILLSSLEKDPDSLFNRKEPVSRVGLDDFYQNLKSICTEAKTNGTTPILLTSPAPSLEKYFVPGSTSSLHSYHDKYNETIRQLAEDENIEIVDLASEFDRHNGLFDDADYDPIHFNVLGHDLAAFLITRKINSLKR
ncbi:MAG TPA: SGNH/GDSL hydrolase family protein [candidate division Zixibacteria bacterium]|nr:SGNH/GDSL hydrolase family protein [candidate division Zixibacteria bacterium]